MDKNTFLNSFSKNSVGYALPSGELVQLYELTAGQRGKLNNIIQKNPNDAQLAIVAMSLDFCADDDLSVVSAIPARYIEEMSDKVLEISGYGDSEGN